MSIRVVAIGNFDWMGDILPYISLRGDWLKDAGFAVGRKVVIEDTKGQITIKLVDSQEA